VFSASARLLSGVGESCEAVNRDLKKRVQFDFLYEGQIKFMNNMEDIMLEVTNSAVENLKTYLADNNIESSVRISLMQGG
jgi:hypothetical protein